MPRPDPAKSHYTYISGRKGSGKSEYAFWEFSAYPFDRLVLDPTHDVTKLQLVPRGIPHRQITHPIPGSWPEWMRDEDVDNGRLTLVYQPDMGDPEARDNMDRALGLCLRDGPPTLCWCDEIGQLCDRYHTGPGLRRALHHGRHDNLSLIMCGPRARDVDPLTIGNADKVVTFRTLNKYDREALAGNMGVDQAEFDAANKALRRYEHTVWTGDTEELQHFAPLPRWRRGARPPVEV
jgi:hypothetical protein